VPVAFQVLTFRHDHMMRLVMETHCQQADETKTPDALILLRLLTGLRTFP